MQKVQISTRFTRAYGVEHPIAVAGMAFAGMVPSFTIAAAKTGVMASFAGVGLMPTPVIEQRVREVQAATAQPFHVNFITIYTQDEHIDLCVALKVRAVSFHWGTPKAQWVIQLQKAGIAVWEQVGSVDAAKKAVAAGIDCVVAQGSEAGGHNYGELPTFALVPAVRDAIGDAMLLAAGGIADGRGLAAALALGADGAWIGTRFVATVEGNVHDAYKAKLVAASGTDTTKTRIFGKQHPEFNPIRVLRNRIVNEWNERADEVPADNSHEKTIGHMDMFGMATELKKFTNLVPMPDAEGDFEELPLLAGQGVGLIQSIDSMSSVVDAMIGQAHTILNRRYE
jgi:NAD(P)H-dependent flavin oxidoreductase YrpB (nitropropane dioxygenase family)